MIENFSLTTASLRQLADIRCANNVLRARVEELEALLLLLRQRAFFAR